MIEFFPERVVDSSIHTSILIGLLILWLFTERFGWAFAGFVVNGYLAALLAVHPMSFAATLCEAILTYGLVWALGVAAPSVRAVSPVFGRERFFLFVLMSIPVRVLVEGVAGPSIQTMLRPFFSDPSWSGGQFFSIGIVLVPLLANSFWKVGLSKSLAQTSVVTLLTYVILLHVIAPLTNFHLGRFELSFDDLALDFLSTSKVYMVLLTTAFIAAQNNIRFGWDYNGILVPALLAVVLFFPIKALATMGEVVALTVAYRALVALPWVRERNLEGPRRLVSMYVLSFLLKWFIAMVSQITQWDVYLSDYFGFGYLLTSLIAVKCYQKRDILRVVVPIGVTAVEGFVVGVGLAWLVARVVPEPPANIALAPLVDAATPQQLERAILLAHPSIRRSAPADGALLQTKTKDILAGLNQLLHDAGRQEIERVTRRWAKQGLSVEWVERGDQSRCLFAHEERRSLAEPLGLPMLIWCKTDGPAIIVPRPLRDNNGLWIAAYLADRLPLSSMVIAGLDGSFPGEPFAERLAEQQHRLARAAMGNRAVMVLHTRDVGTAYLDPRSAAATQSVLEPLQALLPSMQLQFRRHHIPLERLWTALRPTDSMLVVSTSAIEMSMPLTRAPSPLSNLDVRRRLLATEAEPEVSRIERRPTSLEERMSFSELLMPAILDRAHRTPTPWKLPPALAHMAHQLQVRLSLAQDPSGASLWIIESTPDVPRAWGLWIVRPSTSSQWIVGAPMSAQERGTALVAYDLFNSLSLTLFWSSELRLPRPLEAWRDPMDEISETGDVPQMTMRQALRPLSEEGRPPLGRTMILIREQAGSLVSLENVAISFGKESIDIPATRPEDAMTSALAHAVSRWPGLGYQDGRPETTGLASSHFFPVQYTEALSGDGGLVLWISGTALSEVAGTTDHERRSSFYRAIGINVTTAIPVQLQRSPAGSARPPQGAAKTAWHLMESHMQSSAEAPLRALAALPGIQVQAIRYGLRIALFASGPGWFCHSTGDGVSSTAHLPVGCWEVER